MIPTLLLKILTQFSILEDASMTGIDGVLQHTNLSTVIVPDVIVVDVAGGEIVKIGAPYHIGISFLL